MKPRREPLRRTAELRAKTELSRTGGLKRGPVKPRKRSAIIRRLRPDEPVPDFPPRRYKSSHGYIRLRWLVGTQEYVEEFEHRINAGRPPSWMHVHHRNGDKTDNRPENLEVLTASEHNRRHARNLERARVARGLRPVGRQYAPYRGKEAKAKAERREAREARRAAEVERMAGMYAQGLTIVEIGKALGIDHSNVSRRLRAAGVKMRTATESRLAGQLAEAAGRRSVKARAAGICEGFCDGRSAFDVHHRKNRSQGGSWAVENLMHLCRACHRHITTNPAEAYANGWSVRSSFDPAGIPCLRRGQLVWLRSDGTYIPALGGAA